MTGKNPLKPCKDCDGRPEIWAPTSFSGYEVSSHGRVRSVDRIDRRGRNWPGKIMAQHVSWRYFQVGMENEHKKQVYRKVHNVVLEAFVSERPEGHYGLHYDDDPLHNHLDNLRWGTASENAQDCLRNGNHFWANKTHCPRGHLLVEPNLLRYGSSKKCKACDNGRQYVKRHPGLDIQQESDRYYLRYSELMHLG